MSESGYRESSRPLEEGILGSIERLVELEGRPIAKANAAALAQVRTSLDPKAERIEGEGLEARGFRFVGVWSEAIGDAPAVDFDVWVREDRTAYALVRRNELVLIAAPYRIHSYFTDGTMLETLPKPPHVDVAQDASVHHEAMLAKVTDERRVIPISGAHHVARLERFRVTHVLDAGDADQLARIRRTQRWVLLFAIVLAGGFIWSMCDAQGRTRPAVTPSWDEKPQVDAGGR